jgi:hypothetical protein
MVGPWRPNTATNKGIRSVTGFVRVEPYNELREERRRGARRWGEREGERKEERREEVKGEEAR